MCVVQDALGLGQDLFPEVSRSGGALRRRAAAEQAAPRGKPQVPAADCTASLGGDIQIQKPPVGKDEARVNQSSTAWSARSGMGMQAVIDSSAGKRAA